MNKKYEVRKFFDDSNIDEEAEKKKSKIAEAILGVIIFIMCIKMCTADTSPDINEIKTESFWVRIKSSEFSVSSKAMQIKGETFGCKDTTFSSTRVRDFSSIHANDTLIKIKGWLLYTLKSTNYIETKTYDSLDGKWNYEIKKVNR